MTDSEKLRILELLTDETNADVLSIYLNIAKEVVLSRAYPFGEQETIPAKYDTVHVQIAEYLLNKRGAEGETSHSENGISRTYESADVPMSLLRRITPAAGVI